MLDSEKRIKVLIGSPVYLPRQGGASTYFSNLMDKLKDKVDFFVYSCSNPEAKRIEEQNGIRVYRIQPFLLDSPKLIRYLILPPITFFQLFRLWRKHGPFIIHSHSCGAYGYIISVFSDIMKQGMIKEVQDLSDPKYNILRGKVAKYVSTGKTIEKQLISYGVPKDKIITYPSLNPEIDRSTISKLRVKPHEDRKDIELLCISALRPYKGVDYLLKAMRLVQSRDPNIRLTIVGEGGMRQQLEYYIKEHQLENVKLRGFVDEYTDLLSMMAGCDILVLSSASDEGNPRVILESFQFSRPVIATAAGGTPELITNKKNGILVPPKDPNALAEAILDLSRRPDLRRRYGDEGRAFLNSLPTWDDLANEIYLEYSKIWKKMRRI